MKTNDLIAYLLDTYELPSIKLDRKCRLVREDHKEDPRVYAHVFHRQGNAICICPAFDRLRLEHKIGILVHEIGHLMSKGGEAEADLWVQENMGVDIDFRDTLQWVDPKQVGL